MASRVLTAPEVGKKNTILEECHHRWVVEGPEGPISKGVCKLCGAEKGFKNYFRDCLREGATACFYEDNTTSPIEPDEGWSDASEEE